MKLVHLVVVFTCVATVVEADDIVAKDACKLYAETMIDANDHILNAIEIRERFKEVVAKADLSQTPELKTAARHLLAVITDSSATEKDGAEAAKRLLSVCQTVAGVH